MARRGRGIRRSLVAALLVACAGEGEPGLPEGGALEGLYGRSATVTLNGNVVDVRVRQPLSQIVRGGDLWARVGPYVYLFSPQTRELFEEYPGVAAVRVRTFGEGNARVAEAVLLRDALAPGLWREAGRRVARARLRGTANPGYLEDLVRFGEEHARYRYDPRYVRRR